MSLEGLEAKRFGPLGARRRLAFLDEHLERLKSLSSQPQSIRNWVERADLDKVAAMMA